MARTVLITGATGFLGGATLAQLLRAHPELRVVALVRARSKGDGLARLQSSLARFRERDLPDFDVRRVEVICGDIAEPSTFDDERFDQVTHVIHLAANTSFRSVRSVRRVNILGALTLAHRMRRAPHLERFLHVGTGFSCGLLTPGTVIGEDDYPRDDARHVVEYTRSKAEAETLLESTAQELPLTIARPSVIVGHSRLGVRPSASIFWFYRTADLLRRSSNPLALRDDIVPVDYAAEALVALLLKPRLQHRRYHVSAGEGSACSWQEMSAAFDRHHGVRADDPYRVVDPASLAQERERMAGRLGPGDEERMLMALELYFRFPAIVFDNRRLLAEGVAPPPRFVDYLERCMTPPLRSVYEEMADDD